MKYIKYFFYVIEHKINVGIECCKVGLYWHAITHDLSKFRLSEFIPYAKYFYGGKNNKEEFEVAWKLHYHRNKHHWDYWTYFGQDDDSKYGGPFFCPPIKQFPRPMPIKYVRQMLCDWMGMGRKFGDTAQEFYEKNKSKMILHSETIELIENELWRKK